MPNNERPITLTLVAARWLFNYAQRLVSAGIGEQWEPDDSIGPGAGGVIDEIDQSSHPELFLWANALLNLCKALAGILDDELRRFPVTSVLDDEPWNDGDTSGEI